MPRVTPGGDGGHERPCKSLPCSDLASVLGSIAHWTPRDAGTSGAQVLNDAGAGPHKAPQASTVAPAASLFLTGAIDPNQSEENSLCKRV